MAYSTSAGWPLELGGRLSAPTGIALDWALAQVGTPYVWGVETPGVGFDCSGVAQVAYRVAGVALPRTPAHKSASSRSPT